MVYRFLESHFTGANKTSRKLTSPGSLLSTSTKAKCGENQIVCCLELQIWCLWRRESCNHSKAQKRCGYNNENIPKFITNNKFSTRGKSYTNTGFCSRTRCILEKQEKWRIYWRQLQSVQINWRCYKVTYLTWAHNLMQHIMLWDNFPRKLFILYIFTDVIKNLLPTRTYRLTCVCGKIIYYVLYFIILTSWRVLVIFFVLFFNKF